MSKVRYDNITSHHIRGWVLNDFKRSTGALKEDLMNVGARRNEVHPTTFTLADINRHNITTYIFFTSSSLKAAWNDILPSMPLTVSESRIWARSALF